VLTRRNRVRRAPQSVQDAAAGAHMRRAASGSAGRAAAGAFSVGSALGAALTDRRSLGPAEAGLLFLMAAVAAVIGIVGALWPRVLAWPVAFVALWSGTAWVVKGISLRRGRRSGPRVERLEDAIPNTRAPSAKPAQSPPNAPSAPNAQTAQTDAERDRIASR
jgi:cardiolipin synthase A/B